MEGMNENENSENEMKEQELMEQKEDQPDIHFMNISPQINL